jgi:DNA-binding GntR family transcriptional regulator
MQNMLREQNSWDNSPALSAISRRSLKAAAVEQVRAAIVRGELKAGERVTELGLAKRLGVGQATIREALIELEHQGFIQRGGARKTFVTVLTQRDITEIYLVRIHLETLTVELLTANKERDLRESERAYRRMLEAARGGRFNEFSQADLDFHRGLWHSSGNRALAEILERLVPRIFAFGIIQETVYPARRRLQQVAGQHGKLLELIQSGRGKEAQRQMEESMQQAWKDDSELPKPITFRT